jgi:AraC-like DNA-binding protein
MKQHFLYLDEMPEMGSLTCFRPTSRIVEWIQPPGWYLMALIMHHGKLLVSGEKYDFDPGSVLIFEPSNRCRIEIPEDKEIKTHFWINFMPEKVGQYLRAIPRISSLGDQAPFWDSLFREGLNTLPLSKSQFCSTAWSLLCHISENAAQIKMNQYVLGAEDYILKNLSSPLSVAGIAELMQISHNHLIRVFREELGITPSEFIRTKRMHKACHLLLTTTDSIKEIGQKVGYPDPKHFHRVVVATFGIGPTEVRRSKRLAEIYS